jgi:hypothetical protein
MRIAESSLAQMISLTPLLALNRAKLTLTLQPLFFLFLLSLSRPHSLFSNILSPLNRDTKSRLLDLPCPMNAGDTLRDVREMIESESNVGARSGVEVPYSLGSGGGGD